MRDLLILLIHLIATLARLMGPGGLRSVVAESLLVKHQLLILNRSSQRAPNLRASDRILAGACALFMRPARVIRSAIVLKPSTILDFHRILRNRKYRLLFSPKRRGRTGPKGPSTELVEAIVKMKQRNPVWGCPRIAQQIGLTFDIQIDKDVVRRVLATHYRPEPDSNGPSWLTFLGHAKDSLWSIDSFRCESAILQALIIPRLEQLVHQCGGGGEAHPIAFLTGGCLGAQLAISVNNCPPPRDPRSRMTSVKRTQRKYVQKAYRVRNWREYETGLRARGSLTVWLGRTDGKLANWNSPRPTRRTPGRQRQYSNHAIETTVTLGLVFGLASRQTEGFLRSRLTLLNLDNDVPDHSTISRRKARLGKVASYERRTVKPVHLRIDSSGLSVHVGQWRTPPKARDSRKLHLAVDEQTSDVVACELTSKRARDASRVASLVGQIERPIASAKADAAYDTGDV